MLANTWKGNTENTLVLLFSCYQIIKWMLRVLDELFLIYMNDTLNCTALAPVF